MKTDAHLLELQRARWHRHREAARLLDTEDEAFATGGLARFLRETSVRLTILPVDPDGVLIEDFDAPFWEWWTQSWPNPFEGARQTEWGREHRPTADAAVRYDRRDSHWDWMRYIAIHRHGGIEFGTGRDTAWPMKSSETGEVHRRFSLIPIVGRVWGAMSIFEQVLRTTEQEGPWELCLALRETHNAVLGSVGAGWADAEEQLYDLQPTLCPESNILIRREIAKWPAEEELRDFALSIGGAIEDAWGSTGRRYLARVGEDEGTFDISRYS